MSQEAVEGQEQEQQAPVTTEVTKPTPAAPQEPAKAEPAKVDPTQQEEEEGEIEFEATGDPGLDYALSFIARAGIDDQHPAFIAAANGDFGLLKATLAEKGLPGWEQAIALGEKAYQGIKEKEAETVKAVQGAVLQVAEAVGVDWEAAVTHARDNATEDEVAQLNKLFSDPFTAKIAALYITHAYSTAPGVDVPARKQAVKPEAAPAPSAQTGGTLSRVEFAQEAGKLHKKFGDAYTGTPEYRALAARLQR